MLGSVFSSSTSSSSHDEDLDPRGFQILPHPPHSHVGGAGSFPQFNPPALHHMQQLLIKCAELVSTPADFLAARRFLSLLSSTTSPLAESSTERLVHHFAAALSLRLDLKAAAATARNSASAMPEFCETLIQSSYLSLNQITPFVRFNHLTANQAILEAVQGRSAIHVVDFEIAYGLQWPPFMQAIAAFRPPPALRITGAGPDASLLHRTGDRLLRFAQSLGLSFQFHPLLLPPAAAASSFLLPVPALEEEALAVNCVFYLQKLLAEDADDAAVRTFLQQIRAMKPTVVTVAEHEGGHDNPNFPPRFAEALSHYAAIFDSLEATVAPNNPERLAVERVWLGREIREVVGMGIRRHRRHAAWEKTLRELGFRNVPLSGFALSQAKLLLRLHYPSEGYQLQFLDESFLLLGWQSHGLFSVSSWR